MFQVKVIKLFIHHNNHSYFGKRSKNMKRSFSQLKIIAILMARQWGFGPRSHIVRPETRVVRAMQIQSGPPGLSWRCHARRDIRLRSRVSNISWRIYFAPWIIPDLMRTQLVRVFSNRRWTAYLFFHEERQVRLSFAFFTSLDNFSSEFPLGRK